MIRLVALISLLACTIPCFAQAKGKQVKEKWFDHQAGSRFEVISTIVAAADKYEAEELKKSVDANDAEGIESMVKDGKAVKIEPGMTLVVLDIRGQEFSIPPYTECRVIKNGKAIGKHCVNMKLFTDKNMKPLLAR